MTLARIALMMMLAFAAQASIGAADAVAAKPKKGKKEKEKEKEKEKDKEPHDADTKPPIITHVRVTRAPLDKDLVIRAKFDDESEIFAPSVYVRAAGGGEFETIAMKRGDDGWEATIPAATVKQNLEYFIEAFDEQGNGPAREGAPEAPIKIAAFDPAKGAPPPVETTPPIVSKPPPALPKVEPKEETKQAPPPAIVVEESDESLRERHESVTEEWWFWTLIGVAVTGGVVTGVLLLQKSGGGGSGFVDVEVIGPDPAAGL